MNMNSINVFFICLILIIYLFNFSAYNVQGSRTIRKDISATAGESAILPCAINRNECGDFHSIKWYKENRRVFVYSPNNNFAKPEGELRLRGKLLIDSNLTAANLNLFNIKTSDEGEYKCEITFLDITKNCPVVQLVKLTTLAIPTYLNISMGSGEDLTGKVIGPFSEGVEIRLLCESGGGKPIPHLTWYNGTDIVTGRTSSIEAIDKTGVSRNEITVKMTRGDLGGQFTCSADSEAITHKAGRMESSVLIDVNVRPLKTELLGINSPIKSGNPVSLICRSSGARPASQITWYNGSIPFRDIPTTQEIALQNDDTYETQSRISFIATSYENRQKITCEAINEVISAFHEAPQRASASLQVLYAPIVKIFPRNITVNEYEKISIYCTFDSNPNSLVSVKWYKDGNLINVKNSDRYSGATLSEPSLFIERSSRRDWGDYQCVLENAVGSGKSEQTASVSIIYEPTVSLRMVPHDAISELDRRNVTLFCDVTDGHPARLAKVKWFMDGELLKELPQCGNEKALCHIDPSKLLLDNVSRHFHGNFSCRGLNRAGWSKSSENVPLIVNYPPGKSFITKDSQVVVKGDSLRFNCNLEEQGRPRANSFIWTRGGHVVKDVITSEWKIESVTLETEANISCVAINEVGRGQSDTISIEVLVKPECSIQQSYEDGLILLVCDAVAKPDVVSFAWLHGNKSMDETALQNDRLVSSVRINPISDNFGTYICIPTNSLGQGTHCEIDVQGAGMLVSANQTNMTVVVGIISATLVIILTITSVFYVYWNNRKNILPDKDHTDGFSSTDEKYGHGSKDHTSDQHVSTSLNVTSTPHKWPIRPGVHVHVNGLQNLSGRKPQMANNLAMSPATVISGFSYGARSSNSSTSETLSDKDYNSDASKTTRCEPDDTDSSGLSESTTGDTLQPIMVTSTGVTAKVDIKDKVANVNSNIVTRNQNMAKTVKPARKTLHNFDTFNGIHDPVSQKVAESAQHTLQKNGRKGVIYENLPLNFNNKRCIDVNAPSDIRPGNDAFLESPPPLPYTNMATISHEISTSTPLTCCMTNPVVSPTSRPSSQLSQNGSSGYGSTRSQNAAFEMVRRPPEHLEKQNFGKKSDIVGAILSSQSQRKFNSLKIVKNKHESENSVRNLPPDRDCGNPCNFKENKSNNFFSLPSTVSFPPTPAPRVLNPSISSPASSKKGSKSLVDHKSLPRHFLDTMGANRRHHIPAFCDIREKQQHQIPPSRTISYYSTRGSAVPEAPSPPPPPQDSTILPPKEFDSYYCHPSNISGYSKQDMKQQPLASKNSTFSQAVEGCSSIYDGNVGIYEEEFRKLNVQSTKWNHHHHVERPKNVLKFNPNTIGHEIDV